MAEQEPRVALLAGASGLVGGYVLEALLDAPDFARVFAVTRRPLGREHSRLANRIVQFDRLESQLQGLRCQVAFCCLGTTLRRAGSREAFRQVDFDYVLAFARAARAAQAERFVVVSSVGASSRSKHFYLRVKGEMEQALEALQFPALDILQPGLLLGFRRELRPRELALTMLMPVLNPLLGGMRQAYRGIAARQVAAAALGAARSGRRGVYRYTYAGLQALANSKPVRSVPVSPTAQPRAR
jgi:uncharacterized protein YbjT (DUF2867 family)